MITPHTFFTRLYFDKMHAVCAAGISTVGGVTFSGAAQKAACLSVSAQASNPSNKPL